VVTTYDALKAKERVMAVDVGGHVVADDREGSQWMSSRNNDSGSQQTVSLSVLHEVSWFRVIFVDCLGRSSILSKSHTARFAAAVGINATTRCILFKDSDTVRELEKFKENVKHIRACAAVLRIPEGNAADLVGPLSIDYHKVVQGEPME